MSEENQISGPYISTAILCEKVLHEHDGVLSYIRVVDRFTRPKPSPQIPPQVIQANLIVAFKGGGIATGTYPITIRMYGPNPSRPIFELTNNAFFEGGTWERGIVIGTPVVLLADEEGQYYIDVLFMERFATRVPFRVTFVDAQPLPQNPPSS